jgi:TolB-like protein/DNA-binding winged helix-turn-helix (wHTH) protein/Flp pilus assembly protein TadD
LDPIAGQLSRLGKPIPLEPKIFQTLLFLVRNRGRLVEKNELMTVIWPDRFVEEANLTRNISVLRKVLGRDENGGQYIETAARRGYRFVGKVTQHVGSDEDARSSAPVWQEELRAVPEDGVLQKPERSTQDAYDFRKAALEGAAVAVSRPEPVAELPGRITARLSAQLRNPRKLTLGSKLALVIFALAVASIPVLIHFRRNRPTFRATPPSPHSIAVLPFRSLGLDRRNEYLGLGLADALMTRLGNLKQIIVRPTASTKKYEGGAEDPVTAGRELGVDAVLAGSVQSSGERIRVTVQLVNVHDGATVWTGAFDRDASDIFAVEDSISSQVALATVPALSDEEHTRLTKRYTENGEAYESYLKGRYFWNKRTAEGIKKSIDCFRQAIRLDPNYALAYAGLADSYTFGADPSEAKTAAEKALSVDEQLAEAHTSLGNIKLFHDYDWQGAEAEFRRSIELNPNYPTAHHWYAYYLAAMGRFEAAIEEINRARDLDPLSLAINADVGQILYLGRRHDEAIAACKKALEMDPNFTNAHIHLAMVYAAKGLRDAAFSEMVEAQRLLGQRPETLAALRESYAVSGWSWHLQRSMLTGESSMLLRCLMLLQGGQGAGEERNHALGFLERCYELREGDMVLFIVDPAFESLHSDPRYLDLVRRMNLPQE